METGYGRILPESMCFFWHISNYDQFMMKSMLDTLQLRHCKIGYLECILSLAWDLNMESRYFSDMTDDVF